MTSQRHHHHALKSLDAIAESPSPRETPDSSPVAQFELSRGSSRAFLNSTPTSRGAAFAPLVSRKNSITIDELADPVQGTTDDAAVSKLSAVAAGYYEDPYLQHIVRHPTRRSPLINRGYYARIAALRKVLAAFLSAVPADREKGIQVVNLGAGLDTTYFWVVDFFPTVNVTFFEVDFLEVIAKKVHLCTRREAIWTRLQILPGTKSVHDIECALKDERSVSINDSLHFIPVDMRDVSQMEAMVRECGFSSNSPTIFISECALVYMQAAYSDRVIRWAAELVSAPSAFVIYEQVNPNDPFGKTMVKNLELRGCPLLGIMDYPSVEAQRTRFLELGWTKVTSADMNAIYDRFLDKYELVRIQNLELLDEMEEWKLIQGHYFYLVAVNGDRRRPSAAALSTGPAEMSSPNLGYLKELAELWDASHAVEDELPRFTTDELRATFGIGFELARSSSVARPKLCPGPLSPLMCPEASAEEELAVEEQPLKRRWSLRLSGPGNRVKYD